MKPNIKEYAIRAIKQTAQSDAMGCSQPVSHSLSDPALLRWQQSTQQIHTLLEQQEHLLADLLYGFLFAYLVYLHKKQYLCRNIIS